MDGAALRVYYIDTVGSQVEMVTFHTLDFIDIFRFIAADTTVISEEDYNKIINFYVDKLHCQRIACKG